MSNRRREIHERRSVTARCTLISSYLGWVRAGVLNGIQCRKSDFRAFADCQPSAAMLTLTALK